MAVSVDGRVPAFARAPLIGMSSRLQFNPWRLTAGAELIANTYLSELSTEPFSGNDEGMLVLFLDGTSSPPGQLVDPRVIGFGDASGEWELMFFHLASGRAFYLPMAEGGAGLTEAEAAFYLECGF